MIHQATSAIYEALMKIDGLHPTTRETGDSSAVWLQFSVANGGGYAIRFISNDEENNVMVRVFALLHINEDRRARILPALNLLNCRHRHAKFVLDDDGDVNVEYDFPRKTIDPGQCAYAIAARLASIIDDAYPVLMKATWGRG
ncbi:MAG: YbjN domain-containing protein [Clostridia bacterium]|nr:YbjN domain-containing protein [Clostridia bacterium]